MNAIGAIGEALLQKPFRVISFGNDHARCIDKLIQTNFKLSRRKNIVGVRGKTERDREKPGDPESGARGHSCEMRVHMMNPHLLQAQADVSRLIQSKKIGAPAPFIERGDNF